MSTEKFYRNLKKGEIVYESSGSLTVEIEIMSDPVIIETPETDQLTFCDTWRCKFIGKTHCGEQEFSISPVSLMYNCGRLDYSPQYAGPMMKVDGTVVEDTFFPKLTK